MSVFASSGEALRLLAALDHDPRASHWRAEWGARAGSLAAALDEGVSPEAALNVLLEQGPCVFLDADRCGVYGARPDGCRACYVWHDASLCGSDEWDQCVPAELATLRVDRAYQAMLDELEAGRRPFSGHLLPLVADLDRFRSAYLAGDDLAALATPQFVSGGLLEFPSGGDRSEIVWNLKERIASAREQSRSARPFGLPRAGDARSRVELAALPSGGARV